jgi:hypothetical protein
MTAARPPAGTGLPAGLTPPVDVAVARAVTKMPRADTLPRQLTYEPMGRLSSLDLVKDQPGA